MSMDVTVPDGYCDLASRDGAASSSASAGESAHDAVAISGTVHYGDGHPVVNAIIEGRRSRAVTDGDGRYRLDDNRSGEISVSAYCSSVQGIGRLISKRTFGAEQAGALTADFRVKTGYSDEPAYSEVTGAFSGFMTVGEDGVDFTSCDARVKLSENVKSEAGMIAVTMPEDEYKKLRMDNRYFVRVAGTLQGPRNGEGYLWVAYYLLKVIRIDQYVVANAHEACAAFALAP